MREVIEVASNDTGADAALQTSQLSSSESREGWAKRTYRFMRRWPVLPVLVLAALIIAAIFAPILAPHDPDAQSLLDRNQPPYLFDGGTTEYWLGTDSLGRDVLSRVIFGARISLAVAAVSLVSGLLLGVTLGLLSGWYGGKIDEVITRIVDIWHALPFLLVALVVVSLFGGSLTVLMAVLAMVSWVNFVRSVRAEVFVVKSHDYVQISKIFGASTLRIYFKHIIPGVLHTILVVATLSVGGLILTEATLSFLGAGIPPPTSSWGLMVSEGRDYLIDAWWSSFVPGLAIFLTVMALNFLGDWLRDFNDPRLRQQA